MVGYGNRGLIWPPVPEGGGFAAYPLGDQLSLNEPLQVQQEMVLWHCRNDRESVGRTDFLVSSGFFDGKVLASQSLK